MLSRLRTACLPAGHDPLQVHSEPEPHLALMEAAPSPPVHAAQAAESARRHRQRHQFLPLVPGESEAGLPVCEAPLLSSAGPEHRLGPRSAGRPGGVGLSYDGVDP